MPSLKRIFQVFRYRNKEFYRDRSTLGWWLVFPFLLITGFYYAFSSDPGPEYIAGVLGDERTLETVKEKGSKHLLYVLVEGHESGIYKISHHKIHILLDPSKAQYWINKSSGQSLVAAELLAPVIKPWRQQEITRQVVRYGDWVVPGILVMNMMFGGLYGVGYVLVNYRKNGVLRRFKATPLTKFEFIFAQIMSRMALIILSTSIVWLGCNALLDFRFEGSVWHALPLFALGGLCMIAIGLVVSTRTTSKEFADGVLNVISWPLMMVSEIWFSLEGASDFFKNVAALSPLSHVVKGVREVLIDGASFWDTLHYASMPLALTALCLALGTYAFRWE